MVALLVAAWLFPGQRWLEPFRAARRPVHLRDAPRDVSAAHHAFPSARPVQSAAPAHIEVMLERRRRSFRRFSRIHAGISIIAAGAGILFAHYPLARLTGTNPEAEGRLMLPAVFTAIFVLAGAGVLLTRDRDR